MTIQSACTAGSGCISSILAAPVLVPEPASTLLLGVSLLGLGVMARRKLS